MQTESFIKLLSQRNAAFITQMSSESALGLAGFNKEIDPKIKKKCIFISFDPPLSYPPFALNWNSSEVFYFNDPVLEATFYKKIDEALNEAELPFVVFIERNNPPHKRKILRWIKNFKDSVFRNRPISEIPKFVLAEYKAPLYDMKFSDLKADVQ